MPDFPMCCPRAPASISLRTRATRCATPQSLALVPLKRALARVSPPAKSTPKLATALTALPPKSPRSLLPSAASFSEVATMPDLATAIGSSSLSSNVARSACAASTLRLATPSRTLSTCCMVASST